MYIYIYIYIYMCIYNHIGLLYTLYIILRRVMNYMNLKLIS